MQTDNRGTGGGTPGGPWHAGERAVQERAGVAAAADRMGRRAVRPFLLERHRDFFARLPFLVIGAVESGGWPWASLLFGRPGFVTSPAPQSLHIAAHPHAADPLHAAMVPGAPLGILGIDLQMRQRARVNGRISTLDASGISIDVDQSFGNCTKYIQRRTPAGTARRNAVRHEPFSVLDDAARALIASADTCFVASALPPGRPDHGADVSHRGGRPGFLGFGRDSEIVIPDYAGNQFFNTLGNLAVNPRAGLLMIDFDRGDILQFTGTTEIVWEGPEVDAYEGAERLWRLHPSHGQWVRNGFKPRLEQPASAWTQAGLSC